MASISNAQSIVFALPACASLSARTSAAGLSMRDIAVLVDRAGT
jgi:hypothetical protein